MRLRGETGLQKQNLTPLGQRFRMDLCPSPTSSFLRNRPRYVGEPDNSSLPNRPDPHAARYLTVDQRNQNILRHLRAANSLFSQWSEHTEWDELEPLYQNFDSVLNDAWEDIRDADMFFTRVKDNTDDLLPDFYPLDVLLDMQKEVDNLVNQLVILTNDESCMYDEFEQIFRETLPEARRIQSILDQAVDEKTFAGVEFG
jgi:hypothetical protein